MGGSGKSNSRFPSGMTERKARATAKATALTQSSQSLNAKFAKEGKGLTG